MSSHFAVFDIDGTLFRWQLYHEMFDELVRRSIVAVDEAEVVHAARAQWRARKLSFEDYERTLIHLMERAIIGVKQLVLDEAAEAIITVGGDTVYRYTIDLLSQLKKQDYTTIAISGSQQELVERFARLYGIDIAYGRQYGCVNGIITDTSQKVFGRKGEILRQIVQEHSLGWDDSYAVGDSGGDIAMLELVTHPVAFNPDKILYDRARREGWPIVVERKNMVYRLEPDGQSFVLA